MPLAITNYKGLYGENLPHHLPDFVHCEAIVTRSKLYNWEINTHVHTNLFQVFVLDEGEGIVLTEKKEIAMQAPCLVCIPANTLHGFRFQPSVAGKVITLSDSYVEGLFKSSPQVMLALQDLLYISAYQNEARFQRITLLLEQINQELCEELSEKTMVLQALFTVFWADIYRFARDHAEQIHKSDHRNLTYFRNFQKLVKQSIAAVENVSAYAQALHITTVHLNRVCQAVVQKSALAVIHEHLIQEAQQYLLYTNYSVAEVSYLLNFNDPAYFSRLFKKCTGLSPSEYRMQKMGA
ncbi:MAG: helix-turn-helix domain-containing protein [Spirosomataceae bacterium]